MTYVNPYLSTLIVSVVSLTLASCDPPKENLQIESFDRGSVTIYVEDQILPLIDRSKGSFDSMYPNAKVTLVGVTAREAMAKFLADSASGIIIARDYLSDEDSLMKKFNVAREERFRIADDALVLVVNKEFPDDTISIERLRELAVSSTTENHLPRIVLPSIESSVSSVFLKEICRSAQTGRKCRYVGSSKLVASAVTSDWRTIGIGLMSEWISDTSVKLLKVGFTDSSGLRRKPRQVHQSFLTMGLLPFKMPIYAYLTDNRRNLTWGYLSFLAKETAAQRTFLEAGIVPGFARIEIEEPTE